jgi:hypothetical protein
MVGAPNVSGKVDDPKLPQFPHPLFVGAPATLGLTRDVHCPGWNAGHDGMGRDVPGNHGTCPDRGALADGQPA